MFTKNRIAKFLVMAVLAAAFAGCAASPKHESTGQYVDDSVITSKVKAQIFDEPSLKVFQINVKSNRGVVQLSGFVDSAKSIATAGAVAAGVPGVADVKNDLMVK